jgi:hypothetical protein
MIKKITLCGIELRLDMERGAGTVRSDLKELPPKPPNELKGREPNDYGCPACGRAYADAHDAAIDVIESLVLAQALAGLDVGSPAYKEALQSTLDAIGNNL